MRGFLLVVIILLIAVSSSFAADEMRLVNFCTSCHGTNGSGPGESIAIISGQQEEYLNTAMNEMKDKKRRSTMMQIIAQGYNDDEIESISKWFSKREWKSSENVLDKSLIKKGELISASCKDCHGVNGEGDDSNPRIGGQHAKYLYFSLLEYKNKQRNNDGNAAEMDEVIQMKDEDLRALAEYFSSLK